MAGEQRGQASLATSVKVTITFGCVQSEDSHVPVVALQGEQSDTDLWRESDPLQPSVTQRSEGWEKKDEGRASI